MQVFVQTLVSGLGFGAIYALVAMGFSIVYRTMGLVNFAHSDVVMTGAFIAATFFVSSRLMLARWLAMGAAVVHGAAASGLARHPTGHARASGAAAGQRRPRARRRGWPAQWRGP